jgi:hypothetical protein
MASIATALKRSIVSLALVGAAAAATFASGNAHAAQSHSIRYTGPYIQAAGSNCSVTITGSSFTPNGTVDLHVSESGDYTGSYEVTLTASRGLFWPGYGLVGGGKFSYVAYTTIQTTETVQVQAYDESSQQWSNTTVSNVSCLG